MAGGEGAGMVGGERRLLPGVPVGRLDMLPRARLAGLGEGGRTVATCTDETRGMAGGEGVELP